MWSQKNLLGWARKIELVWARLVSKLLTVLNFLFELQSPSAPVIRIETTTVNELPEPMIQHIQSFLNGKEAARTALLSKSWYNAWLTRPSLDFDDYRAHRDFDEFTAKTMQRYRDLNLNIQSFRLRTHSSPPYNFFFHNYTPTLLTHNLIVEAIKMGATDLEFDLPEFTVRRGEVLESAEGIVRLHLAQANICRDFVPYWPCLKSLSLHCVTPMGSRNVVFMNIMSSCCATIEELSLTLSCESRRSVRFSPIEFHKLKSLFMNSVRVDDDMFFSDFASKFPCLKDLSLVNCTGYTNIEIVSTSLQWISLVQPPEKREMDIFDVPNIREFTYSGGGVPSLSINKGRSSTRKWEFDISIRCCQFPGASWFQRMQNLLENMRLSRIKISLSLRFNSPWRKKHAEVNNNFGVLPRRVAVESLRIQAPSKFCCASLLRLLGICCPKLITHYWLPREWSSEWKVNNESLRMLCNVLLSANQMNTFGLNEVKVEIFEKIFDDQWRPLVLKGPLDASKTPVNISVVGFRLIWG